MGGRWVTMTSRPLRSAPTRRSNAPEQADPGPGGARWGVVGGARPGRWGAVGWDAPCLSVAANGPFAASRGANSPFISGWGDVVGRRGGAGWGVWWGGVGPPRHLAWQRTARSLLLRARSPRSFLGVGRDGVGGRHGHRPGEKHVRQAACADDHANRAVRRGRPGWGAPLARLSERGCPSLGTGAGNDDAPPTRVGRRRVG
ncbi:hypothetical protein GCM10023200_52270 [Actinomycetospora chlora]|uniref:Uncharacterized protein n=1 Tax=Actinomycetospora chlora TaxID=663608 RepID=A0ABP9CDC6_9PSEU